MDAKNGKFSDVSQSSSQNLSNHSTESGKWNTRQIATSAFFVALSIATSFIEVPIFPAAPFLKYDPSGVFCLLAGLLFGLPTGCVVAVLPWIFRLVTNPAGAFMSLLMGLAGVVASSLIFQAGEKSKMRLVVSLVVAVLVSTAMAVVANLIVTPAYTGVSVEAVLMMIVPVIIPFNLMKFALNSTIAGLLFYPLNKALK